jgi:nucleoside phosphorylase
MDGRSRRWKSLTMRPDYGMSLVYIFAASTMEAEPVRKMVGSADLTSPASCGPNNLVFVVSGMGPRNARSKAEVALGSRTEPSVSPKPNAVLVIGLCGGLTESLPEGRCVLGVQIH